MAAVAAAAAAAAAASPAPAATPALPAGGLVVAPTPLPAGGDGAFCDVCGKPRAGPESRFCHACGSRLIPTAELERTTARTEVLVYDEPKVGGGMPQPDFSGVGGGAAAAASEPAAGGGAGENAGGSETIETTEKTCALNFFQILLLLGGFMEKVETESYSVG